jgi:chromosome segregation ATPase
MAENQPPPNGRNAAVSSAETSGDERSILATLNGNRTRKLGRKDDTVKQLEASLDLERLKTKSALKDLADLATKLTKLGELSDKRGLKVSELQLELKADRKSAVADLLAEKKAALANLNLEKKIHKKELKVEVEGVSTRVKAQIAKTKEVETARKLLQKKLDASSRALTTLQGAFESAKRKSSELSCDIMSVARSKDSLKDDIKNLHKTIKTLKSKVDNQLAQKNTHAVEMQRMKNEYKQLGLDELRVKFVNKKAGGGGRSSGTMNLEEKKDFITHQALLKQQGKDSDLARAIHQKEVKKKDVQSNLGFAANMLHNTSNLNGGMWSSTAVGDVSC